MTGIASFTEHRAGRFDYREEGWLRLPDGQLIDAARRYLFEEQVDGFSVWFAETPPRLFHRILLRKNASGRVGTGGHLCGDDRYDSRYEFYPDDSFAVQHVVIGPRKRYSISTRYRRA
jgi:hypothetical protein